MAALLTIVVPATGQRIVPALESNADLPMMTGGLMRNGEGGLAGDSTQQAVRREGVVPVGVRNWTIDPIYGTTTEVDVDTLHHHFQNSDHSEGYEGEFNTLANLGSPRMNRVYMNRPLFTSFLFLMPYDQFFVTSDRFRYFDTKSPYMNLSYNWCGSKQTGDDHFKAIYANNVNSHFNFGGIYDYMYGQGYYDHQSTSFMNASAFASYVSDRYDLHFRYSHNYMKMGENGGIEDEVYITHPEDLSQTYGSKDMPTQLVSTWNRQEHDVVYLNHRYHIGFMRTDSDSVGERREFVPVTSLFHTLKLGKYNRNYRSYHDATSFHNFSYMRTDSVNDWHRMFELRNYVGLSLREGFNKYAVAGLSAYVAFSHRQYQMPDTLFSSGEQKVFQTKFTENDIMVGGQIIRTQGTRIHYHANAEFTVAGDNAGNTFIDGEGELNLPLLGDTAQVVVRGQLNRYDPDFFYTHFHATHAWWDNTCGEAVTQTRVQGEIHVPHTKTRLTVGVENVKNYTYFANNGSNLSSSDDYGLVANNVVALQCPDNIQVLSATLQQNFRLGIFHLDNSVTYQTSSNKDVLPLPTITAYSNFYMAFRIAKVLNCELGADAVYFTEYYAPDYSPVIGQFTTQNPEKLVKIGNYPLVSAYVNLHLKRCRFYLQYYHLNQSTKRYFWAPYYPMNPKGLHMGISWNFYD